MKRTSIALFLVFVAGCATHPESPSQAANVPVERVYVDLQTKDPSTAAKVVIVRDKTVAMWGGIGYHQLFIDDKLVASLASGEKFEIFLPPGESVLGVIPALSSSTKQEFTGGWAASNATQTFLAGRTYHFRVLVDGNASSRIQRYFPE
jgi:hypothetical protein